MNLLTNRWFEINPKALDHATQQRFISDFKHNKFYNYTVAAGRRSFKTERFAKRLMVGECLKAANHNKHYYLGAPTLSQGREIFWDDIKQLSPKWAVKSIREVGMKVEFHGGNVLRVIGLKEFKRIQGQLMHGVAITEYQECDPAVYNESIEPMINDTDGFCIKEGRPLGKNHFYDDYLKGVNGQAGWGSYHWTAEEILTAEQIIRAKSNLSIQDYNREYLASFDTEHGAPYYPYEELNHKILEYNPNQPVILTCDFNATVKPMSWVVGQRANEFSFDVTYWQKVLSHQYTNTETMCKILDEYFLTLKSYPKTMWVYGDYRSGVAKQSNSSYTDWELINGYFSNKLNIVTKYRACNSIRDSIGATNAQLCNALGQRKQFINPETCRELILDWQKCEWASNSMELKEDNSSEGVKRGHCCRAVDYYNHVEYPIKPKATGIQA